MRLLLDTHVFLWWLADSDRLSPGWRAAFAKPEHLVMVSAASIWEMAIKIGLGKLRMPEATESGLADLVPDAGFDELAVTAKHAATARTLPRHHADPFDRMLIGQAQLEGLTLVSRDPVFSVYPVSLLPAD